MESIKKLADLLPTGSKEYLSANSSLRQPSSRPDDVSPSFEALYCQRVREAGRREERRFSADELEALALHRWQYFIRLTRHQELSERKRYLIHQLAKYFAYEQGFLPLHKGILLTGCIGCGKTKLFEAFDFRKSYFPEERPLNPKNAILFSSISCNAIARGYASKTTGGVESLNRYFGHDGKNWLFDDLGREDTARYYGHAMDVMGEILQERYSRFPYCRTFITTNLAYEDVQKVYGSRVSSRLSEMCSWVDMGEEVDYRR